MQNSSKVGFESQLLFGQFQGEGPAKDGSAVTRLNWADQKTLYVTKGDAVKVCKIKKRNETHEQLRLKDLPEFYVSIKSSFK